MNDREYHRKWRERNKDKITDYNKRYYDSEQGKEVIRKRDRSRAGTVEQKARAMIKNRVRRNLMPKASFFLCTDCETKAAQYHHEDYSIWWSIEPLCRSCHGKRHRKFK